jgi:hypothetical protein
MRNNRGKFAFHAMRRRRPSPVAFIGAAAALGRAGL